MSSQHRHDRKVPRVNANIGQVQTSDDEDIPECRRLPSSSIPDATSLSNLAFHGFPTAVEVLASEADSVNNMLNSAEYLQPMRIPDLDPSLVSDTTDITFSSTNFDMETSDECASRLVWQYPLTPPQDPTPSLDTLMGQSAIEAPPMHKRSPAAETLTSEERPGKKPRLAEGPGNNHDPDDRSPQTGPQHELGGNSPREFLLACPFYKKDGQRFHQCLRYEFRRIKDVKQHITRRHKVPDFYCARCFEIFPKASLRDVHARDASCAVQLDPGSGFEGISEETRAQLTGSRYTNRGKSIEDQWYDMWDVIFPSDPRPQSVFLGSYTEELVPKLRMVWNDKRSEIMGDVLQSWGMSGSHSIILEHVMMSVFDRFETEMIRGTAPKIHEVPLSTDLSLSSVYTTSEHDAGAMDDWNDDYLAMADIDNHLILGSGGGLIESVWEHGAGDYSLTLDHSDFR